MPGIENNPMGGNNTGPAEKKPTAASAAMSALAAEQPCRDLLARLLVQALARDLPVTPTSTLTWMDLTSPEGAVLLSEVKSDPVEQKTVAVHAPSEAITPSGRNHKTNKRCEADLSTWTPKQLAIYNAVLDGRFENGEMDMLTDAVCHKLTERTTYLATFMLVDPIEEFESRIRSSGIPLRREGAPYGSVTLYDTEEVRTYVGEKALDILQFVHPVMPKRESRWPMHFRFSGYQFRAYAVTSALRNHLRGTWRRTLSSGSFQSDEVSAFMGSMDAALSGIRPTVRMYRYARPTVSVIPPDIRTCWSGFCYLLVALWIMEDRYPGWAPWLRRVHREGFESFCLGLPALTPRLKRFALACERAAQEAGVHKVFPEGYDELTGPTTSAELIEIGRFQRIPVHDGLKLAGPKRHEVAHETVRLATPEARQADVALQEALSLRRTLFRHFPSLQDWLAQGLVLSLTDYWQGRLRDYHRIPWAASNSASLTFPRRVWGDLESYRSLGAAWSLLQSEEPFSKLRKEHQALLGPAEEAAKRILEEKEPSDEDKAHQKTLHQLHETYLAGHFEAIREIYAHRTCRNLECKDVHLHPKVYFDPHMFQREGKVRTLGRIEDSIMPFYRLFSFFCRGYTSRMPGQEEATQGLSRTAFDRFESILHLPTLRIRNADAVKSTNNILPETADAILIPAGKFLDDNIGEGLTAALQRIDPTLNFQGMMTMHGMPVRPYLLNHPRATMDCFWGSRSPCGDLDPPNWKRALAADFERHWPEVHLCTPVFPEEPPQGDDIEFSVPPDDVQASLHSPILEKLACHQRLPSLLRTLATSNMFLSAPTGTGKTSSFVVGAAVALEAYILVVVPSVISVIGSSNRARIMLEQCGSEITVGEVYAERGPFQPLDEKLIFSTTFHPTVIAERLHADYPLVLILDEPEQYPTETILLRNWALARPRTRLCLMSATLPGKWVETWTRTLSMTHELVENQERERRQVVRGGTMMPHLWWWRTKSAGISCLIFCESRRDMTDVQSELDAEIARLQEEQVTKGLPVTVPFRVERVHGSRSRNALIRTMTEMPTEKTVFLGTDICTTSISIPGCTLVLDQPCRRGTMFDPATASESLTRWKPSPTTTQQRQGRAGRARDSQGNLLPSRYVLLDYRGQTPSSGTEPEVELTQKLLCGHPLGANLQSSDVPLPVRTRVRASQFESWTPAYDYNGPRMDSWLEKVLSTLPQDSAFPYDPAEIDFILAFAAACACNIWGEPASEAWESPNPARGIGDILNQVESPPVAGFVPLLRVVLLLEIAENLNGVYQRAANKFQRLRQWYLRRAPFVTAEELTAGITEPTTLGLEAFLEFFQCLETFPHLCATRVKMSKLAKTHLAGSRVTIPAEVAKRDDATYFCVPPWAHLSAGGVGCVLLIPLLSVVDLAPLVSPPVYVADTGSREVFVRGNKLCHMSASRCRESLVNSVSASAVARAYLAEYAEVLAGTGIPDLDAPALIDFLNLASCATGKVLQSVNHAGRRIAQPLRECDWSEEAKKELPELHAAVTSNAKKEDLGYGDDSTTAFEPLMEPLLAAGDSLAPFVNGPATVTDDLIKDGKPTGACFFECERLAEVRAGRVRMVPAIKVGTVARVLARGLADVLPVDVAGDLDFQATTNALPDDDGIAYLTDHALEPKLRHLAALGASLDEIQFSNADLGFRAARDASPRLERALREAQTGPKAKKQSLYDFAARLLGTTPTGLDFDSAAVVRDALLSLVRTLRVAHS